MAEGDNAKRGSDAAREWARHVAGDIGRAVHLHRNRLGLSAVQLANRCREIGYPITRGTIAKIESNSRNGKMDVAEILVLAAALELAPADLMFPGYPADTQLVTPIAYMNSKTAREWFVGDRDYNEFAQLHTPRIVRSREISQAIEDFNRAVSAFEERRQPQCDNGRWWLAGIRYDSDEHGMTAWDTAMLKDEYKVIEGLYEKVEAVGGSVIMPDWFETFDCAPF